MKNVRWIFIFLMMATVPLYAQRQTDQSNSQPKNAQQQNSRQQDGITNPGQSKPQQDADGQDTQGDAAATAGAPGAAEAAADANNSNENGEGTERAVNAPAVIQSTSSQSGSPAVLSEGDGKQRDGTNTVQRASMNMVGSPANNIRLNSGRSSIDADDEMTDRQIHEQDTKASATNKENRSGTSSSGDGVEQINDNTRIENNAQSDQNLSSKEKTKEEGSRSDRKAKRKDGGA